MNADCADHLASLHHCDSICVRPGSDNLCSRRDHNPADRFFSDLSFRSPPCRPVIGPTLPSPGCKLLRGLTGQFSLGNYLLRLQCSWRPLAAPASCLCDRVAPPGGTPATAGRDMPQCYFGELHMRSPSRLHGMQKSLVLCPTWSLAVQSPSVRCVLLFVIVCRHHDLLAAP